MNGISGFLERYKNFISPPLAAARAVRTAILDIVGISVAESAVQVKNGKATIDAGALEKTEILLHKTEIVAHARMRVGDAVKEIK